jgi:hypothetical protein
VNAERKELLPGLYRGDMITCYFCGQSFTLEPDTAITRFNPHGEMLQFVNGNGWEDADKLRCMCPPCVEDFVCDWPGGGMPHPGWLALVGGHNGEEEQRDKEETKGEFKMAVAKMSDEQVQRLREKHLLEVLTQFIESDEAASCLASTIFSGQRRLFFPTLLLSIAALPPAPNTVPFS